MLGSTETELTTDLQADSTGIPLASAIMSLKCAVHAKDGYTAAHNKRVSHYAINLARAIGMEAGRITTIEIGSQLHDVGKIGVPDAVLLKPAKLTLEEFRAIQRHSEMGATICNPLNLDPLAKRIIRHHHERLDGSGYPDGLKGAEIPLEVQVVAIADLFDALRTNRVYRTALAREQVWDIIQGEALRGLHDTCLVTEFIRTIESYSSLRGE